MFDEKKLVRDLPEQAWKSQWTKTLSQKGVDQHSLNIIAIQTVEVLVYSG